MRDSAGAFPGCFRLPSLLDGDYFRRTRRMTKRFPHPTTIYFILLVTIKLRWFARGKFSNIPDVTINLFPFIIYTHSFIIYFICITNKFLISNIFFFLFRINEFNMYTVSLHIVWIHYSLMWNWFASCCMYEERNVAFFFFGFFVNVQKLKENKNKRK